MQNAARSFLLGGCLIEWQQEKAEQTGPAYIYAEGKMNQKLIFLDIDGTLTSAGSNIPPESAMTAVREAQKKGHKVFLCTGR